MFAGSVGILSAEETGIHDNLIRLNIGIEDIYDIIQDLKQAFD
jgi:cystathionine beta-lyase/cystathionine gamma-synthase